MKKRKKYINKPKRSIFFFFFNIFLSTISSSVSSSVPSMMGGRFSLVRSALPSLISLRSAKARISDMLLERPRVISANVGHAWDLPENTFGAAYARFMGSRNFSPDDRPPVRFMETEELAYVAMRAREVHDFWHTLFDLPTNLIGESALKVIEFEQMYLPMCLLSVVGGTARFNEKQRALFFKHYLPWATRAGMQCTDLMCIYYEQHFHEDLAVVRKRWGITPAPAPPK